MSESGRTAGTEWQWIRNETIIRDDYECQECGKQGGRKGDATLHVHHIEQVQDGGSDDLDNLITLCARCHQSQHTTDEEVSDKQCCSPTTVRRRDENTGQFVDKHHPEDICSAIKDLGGKAATSEIVDELGRKHNSVFRKLQLMEDDSMIDSQKVGGIRIWKTDETSK